MAKLRPKNQAEAIPVAAEDSHWLRKLVAAVAEVTKAKEVAIQAVVAAVNVTVTIIGKGHRVTLITPMVVELAV